MEVKLHWICVQSNRFVMQFLIDYLKILQPFDVFSCFLLASSFYSVEQYISSYSLCFKEDKKH